MRRGILFSLFCLGLLGAMPIISNSRPMDLDALSFAFYLSFWQLISSLPLTIKELRSDNKGIFEKALAPSIRNNALKVMLITGFIFSITTYLYVLSFEKAGTVSAAIAIQTYPMFAILIEAIVLRKMKSVGELFSTFLLITGIYYLGTEGTWVVDGFSVWFAIALVVPLLWSIAHVTIKNTLKVSPITPNQVTFIRVVISSVVLFGLASMNSGIGNVLGGFTSIELQLSAIFMGLFYYMELVSWFHAMRHIDVSLASSIITPTPILTILLAVIFLKDYPENYQIISLGVVLLSLYGILYFGRKKEIKKKLS